VNQIVRQPEEELLCSAAEGPLQWLACSVQGPSARWAVAVALLLVGVVAWLVWRRLRKRDREDDASNLLVFHPRAGAPPLRRSFPPMESVPPESPTLTMRTHPSRPPGGNGPTAQAFPRLGGASPMAGSQEAGATGEPAPLEGPPGAPDAIPDPLGVDAGTVRFHEAPEGTLQLLPGRLEILSGPGSGTEIRFVRLPQGEVEITFGRHSGAPYRHVQLRAPTVSRVHARLRMDAGGWTLSNLSATNPTLLNRQALIPNADPVRLRDGDRIEMGEVVFLFHYPENPASLPFRTSWHTEQGPRPTNQDAGVVTALADGRELLAVCDGMGSHRAGGIASRDAVTALVNALQEGYGLREAVERCNGVLRRAMEADPALEGMGTTLVALLLDGERYEVANVGDSRAYHIDEAGIRQITQDHSFVAEVVTAGRMTPREASRSPWKHAITRSLGGEDAVEVDIFPGEAGGSGHRVVLCTDGVHGVLSDEEIREIVQAVDDIRDVAATLCRRALAAGSGDNVTVAALQIPRSGDGVADPAPR